MPDPTPHDIQMARIRQEIADRQAEAYGDVLAWSWGAFGPGWLPSCRHYLVSKESEEHHRKTGEAIIASATVYTVRHQDGRKRHFTVDAEGLVHECASYESGFGPMLLEEHPTRGFTDKAGVFHHYHRYSLCWADFPLYSPKSADQLAALRESRERNKAAREQKKYEQQNPLLVWIERVQAEEEMGRER